MRTLRLTRRELLVASAATSIVACLRPQIGFAAIPPQVASTTVVADSVIQFALLSETHAVDRKLSINEFVCGREAGFLMTNEALEVWVDHLRELSPQIEFVVHAGNLLHGLPDADANAYFSRDSALDIVSNELYRLDKPFQLALGPFDYGALASDKDLAHDVLRAKLNVAPYGAFEHKGWSFVTLNSNLVGENSLGQEQVDWFASVCDSAEHLVITMNAHPALVRGDGLRKFREIVASNREKIAQIFCSKWEGSARYGFEGVPVQAVSEQRHDADSLLVVQIDRNAGTIRYLNEWMLI